MKRTRDSLSPREARVGREPERGGLLFHRRILSYALPYRPRDMLQKDEKRPERDEKKRPVRTLCLQSIVPMDVAGWTPPPGVRMQTLQRQAFVAYTVHIHHPPSWAFAPCRKVCPASDGHRWPRHFRPPMSLPAKKLKKKFVRGLQKAQNRGL